MRTAVVLIGGLGTRLYPLTDGMPKAAVPFLDKPIIGYPMTQFREAEIERVVLCLGHGSNNLVELFESNDGFGMEFIPVFEDEPLGTGGALANALDKLPNESEVLVANGDILSNIDISAMLERHRRNNSALTIALFKVDDPRRFGLVTTTEDNRVVEFREKTDSLGEPPYLVNTGVYILDPLLLASLLKGEKLSLEHDLFPRWIEQEHIVSSFVHSGFWRDIGTLESYYRAHFEVLHHYMMYDPAFGNWENKGFKLFKGYIYIDNSVKLKTKAKLDTQVVLMRGVEVGEGASLSRTIVMPFANIGSGVSLENVIVGPEVEIQDGTRLTHTCITKTKKVGLDW